MRTETRTEVPSELEELALSRVSLGCDCDEASVLKQDMLLARLTRKFCGSVVGNICRLLDWGDSNDGVELEEGVLGLAGETVDSGVVGKLLVCKLLVVKLIVDKLFVAEFRVGKFLVAGAADLLIVLCESVRCMEECDVMLWLFFVAPVASNVMASRTPLT